MKRKNTMRNALVTSVISMLLCISMLVGTTFAWFTDEVVSGRNTIAAGNLDIELLADGNKVDSNTVLFDNERLWEPGAVVYENLQIANVGTLALKYQLSLNVFAENSLNGHKLSEVVKVALVDKIEAGATREEVLAAAKASTYYVGELSNFYLTGSLEAGKSTDEASVVVFWEPTDHDNDYNANNGQKTSDGKPLFIEFGINLQATQKMSEYDSFGNDYDEAATIMPKAKVTNLGAQKIIATTDFPNGNDPMEYNAPFVLKFEPNESYDEALAGEYALYHADFVVKADRDVPGNSMALAGYYKAACDLANNGNWVAMTTDQTIAANTDVRLVSNMNVTVNYSEICNYGNDGTGFQCTAIDLTGANAGTTVTVELRMFKVPAKGECAEGGGCNHPFVECETGESYLIGTYTYTFPAQEVATQDDLDAALKKGGDVKLAAGNYTFPNSSMKAGQTLYCEEGTVFTGASLNANGATIVGATFKNTAREITVNGIYKDCTFEGSNGLRYGYAGETVVFENCVFSGNTYGVHFDGGANEVLLKNCTLSGFNATGSALTLITFENCTFVGNGKSAYNGINLWGETVMTGCTFVFDGSSTYEWIDLCSADKNASFTNCVVDNGTTVENLSTVLGTALTKRNASSKIIIDGVEVTY